MPSDPIGSGQSDPLGSSLSDLDARVSALEKTGQWWPGMIAWTASSVAPAGFLIADGSAFDTARYAALSAALGGASTLPNLIDSFPVGAGNLYPLLTVGGAATHLLTAAESGMPGIPGGSITGSTTPGSTGAGTAHSHGSPVGGDFGFTGFTAQTAAGGAFAAVNNHSPTTATESAHTHPSAAHTHTIPAVAAASAASAHSILNPYVALTPLIHV